MNIERGVFVIIITKAIIEIMLFFKNIKSFWGIYGKTKENDKKVGHIHTQQQQKNNTISDKQSHRSWV